MKMVLFVISAFCLLLANSDMYYLTQFKDSDPNWYIVNDGVMGGLSQSRIYRDVDSTAIFEGVLSLDNNGGFASVRMKIEEDLEDTFTEVKMRVLGDGRSYNFRIRKSGNFDGLAYDYAFETVEDKWIEVSIPLNAVQGTFRGRRYKDKVGLKSNEISQIGILIGDKKEGKFRLKLEYIALSK